MDIRRHGQSGCRLAACGSLGEGARGERYRMGSRTMEPTITAGSIVTAEVVKPGDYQPRTGDVVVFEPPESWDHGEGEAPWIFRVVAVPGDTIAGCDAEGRIVRHPRGRAVRLPCALPDHRQSACTSPSTDRGRRSCSCTA
ncbi:S26 family signal peptidase [Micromonospora sp. NPDC047738]|uniref:S26 family signal peptidase n=1 Tax=unclassified Micromonospora TaxID=2617518 RepID=UPI0033D334CB